MKTTFWSCIFLFFVCFLTVECKKTFNPLNNNNNNNNNGGNNNGNPNSNKPGFATSVGLPSGGFASKMIPASGGSISSFDGRIELVFPAGALPADDTITIMTITNMNPGGIGDAYRFLPDGLKFVSPITVKFHYTDGDINGTIPDFLHVAFQDSGGVWNKVSDNAELDTVAKTISVTTKHFSDWDIFPDLRIITDGGDEKNGQLRITKQEQYGLVYIPLNDAGKIVGDGTITNVYSTIVKEWDVNGVKNGNPLFGTIAPPNASSILTTCTYTAPAQVPQVRNPVSISVRLQNLTFLDPKFGSFNDLTVTYSVKIIGLDFIFDVTIVYHDDRIDGGLVGAAFTADDNASLTVTVKNGKDVTVNNITNHGERITPASQSSSGCTSTSNASGDYIDIVSGSGTVVEGGADNPPYVQVIYVNSGTTYPSFTVNCDGSGQTVGGYALGNTQNDFGFILADSTQTIDGSTTGTKVNVTIKPHQ